MSTAWSSSSACSRVLHHLVRDGDLRHADDTLLRLADYSTQQFARDNVISAMIYPRSVVMVIAALTLLLVSAAFIRFSSIGS